MTKRNFVMPFRAFGTRAACVAGLLLGASWMSSAHAEPTYPVEIQNHLPLSYTPPCTICHSTPQGGGIPTTAFGKAMVSAGLNANISSLDPALDTLEKNATDSNGDNIPDIQSLRQGIDPSTGASLTDVPTEKYGCGARIATGQVRPNSAVTFAMVCLGLVLLSRRRTRNP